MVTLTQNCNLAQSPFCVGPSSEYIVDSFDSNSALQALTETILLSVRSINSQVDRSICSLP